MSDQNSVKQVRSAIQAFFVQIISLILNDIYDRDSYVLTCTDLGELTARN